MAMEKILISVIMLTLAIGCGEKEKQVVTTEHVWGNVYVNKRMPKSEYEAMTKKRDSLDREYFNQNKREEKYSQATYYSEPINTEKFEKMDMISVNYEIEFWLFMLFFLNLILFTVLTVSSKPDD
ncbi:hypothetical protein R83H12_00590 [Fibrobacteria bacterium R8-3-H12]